MRELTVSKNGSTAVVKALTRRATIQEYEYEAVLEKHYGVTPPSGETALPTAETITWTHIRSFSALAARVSLMQGEVTPFAPDVLAALFEEFLDEGQTDEEGGIWWEIMKARQKLDEPLAPAHGKPPEYLTEDEATDPNKSGSVKAGKGSLKTKSSPSSEGGRPAQRSGE